MHRGKGWARTLFVFCWRGGGRCRHSFDRACLLSLWSGRPVGSDQDRKRTAGRAARARFGAQPKTEEDPPWHSTFVAVSSREKAKI